MKVDSALAYLKANNSHYKNITLDDNWQEQFQNEDSDLWEALVVPENEQTKQINDDEGGSNSENHQRECVNEKHCSVHSQAEHTNETATEDSLESKELEDARRAEYINCSKRDDQIATSTQPETINYTEIDKDLQLQTQAKQGSDVAYGVVQENRLVHEKSEEQGRDDATNGLLRGVQFDTCIQTEDFEQSSR